MQETTDGQLGLGVTRSVAEHAAASNRSACPRGQAAMRSRCHTRKRGVRNTVNVVPMQAACRLSDGGGRQ